MIDVLVEVFLALHQRVLYAFRYYYTRQCFNNEETDYGSHSLFSVPLIMIVHECINFLWLE